MVPWRCPNCGTSFQYHPIPCPLCEAERARKEIDMSGVREAAAGIRAPKAKEAGGAELGQVASFKERKKK